MKIQEKGFLFLLIFVLLALIFNFIYFNTKIKIQEETMSSLKEDYNQNNNSVINILNNTYINYSSQKKYDFQCLQATKKVSSKKVSISNFENLPNLGSTEKIAFDGLEYLRSLGGPYYLVYDGLICNKSEGWSLVNGWTSEVVISQDENGNLETDKNFFASNGFFARNGDISILCCRVI